MSIVAIQIRLPWTTDAAEGPVSSNTFHFDSFGTTPSEANIAPVAQAVFDLYENGLAGAWSSLLKGELITAAYNLDDPKPRLPFAGGTAPLTVSGDTIAPESSVNVGYRYPRATGVPTQRGRGTMHFGPLSKSTVTVGGLLADSFMDQLETALGNFATAIHASLYEMVTGSELHGFETIEQFTIGNDFGIVRRRDLHSTDKRTVAY